MNCRHNKLIGKIIEVYASRKKFADEMGFSERTISLKLQGKIDWKVSEIIKACDLLGIPMTEMYLYFFDK